MSLDSSLVPVASRRSGGPAVLCADIGGSFIKFAVADGDGVLRDERRVPTPAGDWPAFEAALAALCADADPALALSLSIAGTIDPDDGVSNSANIPCISGRHVGAELTTALGRPVRAANDADCFVLAEALRGAGAGHRIVFGVILGTGVGGGLVVDGAIVEGAGGVTGEWGHGPVVRTTRFKETEVPAFACGCGQIGCVDTIGGARGLERLDRSLNGGARDSSRIVGDWLSGEPAAADTLALYLDLVAGPLAFVINVTGASIVPVGGGLSNSLELVEALDHAVRARILRRTDAPLVVPARLGSQAGLIGAALTRPSGAPSRTAD